MISILFALLSFGTFASSALAQDPDLQPLVTPKKTLSGKKVPLGDTPDTGVGAQEESSEKMAVEIEGAFPVVLGVKAQNYTSQLGGMAHFYLPHFISPFVDNYFSAGYQGFGLPGGSNITVRIFPIFANLALSSRLSGSSDRSMIASIGVGVGGALAYLDTPGLVAPNLTGYFATQIRPGFEFGVSEMVSITAHTPVLFLFGMNNGSTGRASSLIYLMPTLGAKVYF